MEVAHAVVIWQMDRHWWRPVVALGALLQDLAYSGHMQPVSRNRLDDGTLERCGMPRVQQTTQAGCRTGQVVTAFGGTQRNGDTLLMQHALDRAVVHLQLLGDGANGPFLDEVKAGDAFFEMVGNQGVPQSAGSSKAASSKAGQHIVADAVSNVR